MEISLREQVILSLSLGKFSFLVTKKYFKWFFFSTMGETMKNDDSASKRVWSVNSKCNMQNWALEEISNMKGNSRTIHTY